MRMLFRKFRNKIKKFYNDLMEWIKKKNKNKMFIFVFLTLFQIK
jgi:hypothetical protein